MHFRALATDYDGTLAHEGRVRDVTIQALCRLIRSGRKAILVTGREIPDLLTVFPHSHLELFDLVVAENGALLYFPKDQRQQLLSEPPPATFVEALRERGVLPLTVGCVIVASCVCQSAAVLDVIHTLGLELQVIFNKSSLMVLPSGVNKATGLAAALNLLGIKPGEVVAVGDAENDHALLRFCGYGAAVANAVPALKQRANTVLDGVDGDGVIELIGRLVENDLQG